MNEQAAKAFELYAKTFEDAAQIASDAMLGAQVALALGQPDLAGIILHLGEQAHELRLKVGRMELEGAVKQ